MRDTLLVQLLPDGQARWQRRPAAAGATPENGHGPVADIAGQAVEQRLIVLAPTQDVLLTHVELAVKQKARLLQAIPYALEDQLAGDIDDLHFAVGQRDAAGHTPVAVVEREKMDEWLAPFQDAGCELDQLIPDALALPFDGQHASLALLDDRDCLARTGPATGFACDLDLLPVMLMRQTVLHEGCELIRVNSRAELPTGLAVTRSHAPEHWLDLVAPTPDAGRIDLLQGGYSPRDRQSALLRQLRVPIGLAAGWLLLATATLAVGNWQKQGEVDSLRDHAMGNFQSAFPQITRIVDLRVQAERELERLRGGGTDSGFLFLLGQCAAPLNTVDKLQLDGAQFRDGSLYLSLSGSDLQALEVLRAEFAKLPNLKLDVQSAQAGSEGVQIRLKVDLA